MALVDVLVLQKFTGDPSDEVPEAAYRLAANRLSSNLISLFEKQLTEQHSAEAARFLKSGLGHLVFNFALASVLELLPGETLRDQRARLAYNLRVESYQNLGDKLIPLLDGEVRRALQEAGAGSEPRSQ